MSELLAQRLRRRTFLKAAVTATALAAVGDKFFGGPLSTLAEGRAAQQGEDVWIPSACYMCFTNCGIRAHRVNGTVVKIEGHPDNINKGKLCARGNAGLMKLYNPYRVKTPLKRTNPDKGRGVDPKWVEISWDEALDTVAARLKDIMATDPRQLMVMMGWGTRMWGGRADTDIAQVFNSPNGISGPGGMTCYAGIHEIGYIQNGTSTTVEGDVKYCNYLIEFGASLGVNKASPQETRDFWEARERGMKFVVVDTRLSPEANKADEWIPIRGGTDLAVVLALIHVLLYEKQRFDVDFIKQRTNAPYLVRLDNGLYVRSATELMAEDAARKNQKLGKPYIWDAKDNKPKLFDDKSIADYALEGEFTVDGVACKPGFQLMKEAVKDNTPEWAEGISGVPAATIRRLADELLEAARIGADIVVDGHRFPYRPVAVTVGRGGQTHTHGVRTVEAACILNYLLGSAETPGGNTVRGAVQKPAPDGTNQPQGVAAYRPVQEEFDYAMWNTYWPISYKAFWATWHAILEPEKYGVSYKLQALMILGANPIFGFGSPDLVTEAMKKIPFIFAISYHLDEPTELADIVFPDAGYTEWLHMTGSTLRQPLTAKPLFDTRLPEETVRDIAERAGVLANFNKMAARRLRLKEPYVLDPKVKYTAEEMVDLHCKSTFGETHDLAWFRKNGVLNRETPEREDYAFYHNPATRYHLYLEYKVWTAQELESDLKALNATHPVPDWKEYYRPLPFWKPNPTLEAPAEFDLFENNYRGALMSMGFSPDNPWTSEAMSFDPYYMAVCLNPATAAAKGLKDGDEVWVESYVREAWSKVKGELRVTETVHPEACIIGGQWGRWAIGMNPIAQEGPHHNSLLSIKMPYCDQFSGNIEMAAKVKVYKA